MSPENIYPTFHEKLEKQLSKKIIEAFSKGKRDESSDTYHVLISFNTKEQREAWLKRNSQIKNIQQFDLIPSFKTLLTKNEILQLNNDKNINQIEEDQDLYLSLLETQDLIKLTQYRKSAINFSGKGVVIGLIDDGINSQFDCFSGVVLKKYKLHEHSERGHDTNPRQITHGTLMASIISNQYVDYEDNHVGIAPEAKLIDYDISNEDCRFQFSNVLNILDLIDKESKKPEILQISFTTLAPSDGNDILSSACDKLSEKNQIIITSPAGNFGPELATIGSPAAARNVITFGSLTKTKTISYFSGRGPTLDGREKPDFCLPGSKIEIPLTMEITTLLSGTCVATSIGTALIALLKEADPDLGPQSCLELLKKVAQPIYNSELCQGYRYSDIPQLFKALNLYQEKPLKYKSLLKRAITISSEFIAFLLILVYIIFYFIDFYI